MICVCHIFTLRQARKSIPREQQTDFRTELKSTVRVMGHGTSRPHTLFYSGRDTGGGGGGGGAMPPTFSKNSLHSIIIHS